jgi:hypothetical protein
MRPDDLSDERLDEALRRQPRWEPPRHFVRSVVARMPLPAPSQSGGAGWIPLVVRAALDGVLGASLAYAVGVLLVWATFALIPDVITAASAYEMLMDVATAALVDHATVIGWVSVAVMLLISASVTGRAREWI